MLLLDGLSVDSLVDPGELVGDIGKVYLSDHVALERISSYFEEAWLGVMRGYHKDLGILVKLVGIFPRASPRVKGVVIVIDPVSGGVKALIDAHALTGWRTACASALAYRLMGGPSGVDVLGVIGSGTQALYHLRVFTRLYRVERILVSSRSRERAEELSRQFGAEVSDLEGLLRSSSLVIAATNSTEPVVMGSLLRGGAFVISVGAPRPVRELDGKTLERARCALVDTKRGVREESDDTDGLELVELGEALRGYLCNFGDVKLYKSVGTPTLDIAGALHVLRRAGESLLPRLLGS